MLNMAESQDKRPRKPPIVESRKGRKSLSAWVPEEMTVALKVLAAEQRMAMQDLIIELLNDGLEKYGKKRIESE